VDDQVFHSHFSGQEHDVSRTLSLVIIINISLHALSCWTAKTLRVWRLYSRPSWCKSCTRDSGLREVSRDGYNDDTTWSAI
jgi:hypothetical protein